MGKGTLFLIGLILILFSCNQENETDNFFKIGIEESFSEGIANISNDSQLKFSISNINDSRCPKDVNCIWAGMVTVKVEMISPQHGIVELNSLNKKIDTLGDYSFELIDVFPYPKSGVTIKTEDYNVILRILKIID